MSKLMQLGGLVALLAIGAASDVRAQEWDTYTSEAFNIAFSIPAGWQTETQADEDVPSLVSQSPDGNIVLVVLAYEDEEIGTEALLDNAVDMLDIELEGEAEEQDLNGLHAWVAVAAGDVEGTDAGIVIMAATYEANNYIAYIFTPAEAFEEHVEIMGAIIDSFAPIE